MSAAPAAPPAAGPPTDLPADAAAAVDAGRPVTFRHPRTGAVFHLAPGPAARGDRPGGAEPDDELTDEEYRRLLEEGRRAQIEIDGGEITEVEALRRALAFNEAEAAEGRGPMTTAEADAEMEAAFPELRAHRERRRAARNGRPS